jgi:hypothetical protein
MRVLKKYISKNLLFFVLFFLLACFITYPLIFNLGKITTGYGDELLIAWIQNWNIHKILEGPLGFLGIFNTNSYFPYLNTLAYSETFITSSLISFLPLLFLKEPIAANNVTIVSSIALLGFCSYLLAFYLTKDFAFSFLSGILIQFSPAILDKLVHLQVLTIYFLPLAIYFFINFLQTKKFIYYFIFLFILLLQIYNSFMPGYFIIFSALLISFFFITENKKKLKSFNLKKIILPLFVLFLLVIPIILPYYKVSSEFKYVRDIRDAIHLSLQPEDFISTNSYSRFNKLFSSFSFNHCSHVNCEVKPGFLGGVFSILTVFSLIYLIKNWKKQKYIIKGLYATSVLGLILSLGPFLHLSRYTIHSPFPIPLPYALFYYTLPGFNGFRSSGRFEMMFLLPMAVLIPYVLAIVLKKVSKIKIVALYLILCLGIILEFSFPIKFYPIIQIKDFSKVYSWLNNSPKQIVIIEMPIFTWNMLPYVFNENWRLYYSTANFRNMVNGASGFSPTIWQNLVAITLEQFPNSSSIKTLKKLGVNLVIVHKKEYDLLYKNKFNVKEKRINNGDTIIKTLKTDNNVELIKVFDDDYVFKIK